jgi:hypothetical protein
MKNLRDSLSSLALVALLGASNGFAATGTINNPPGITTAWNDTSGNRIKNNCGGMLQVGGTFYWYGWDPLSHTVNCYTSTTLGSSSWAKVTSGGFPMFGSGFHGRPDVIRRNDGVYVMIVECSTSGTGRNGVQYYTSSSPAGPFTFQRQDNQVMLNNSGGWVNMGDKGLYQDEDAAQTVYLLCTSDDGGVTNSTTKIIRLTADALHQSSVVQSWTYSPKREALAMFKRNGTYYLFASRTLGWDSSETPYKTASSISGTWTQWTAVPTSPTSTNSFDTQHDFIVKIVGTSATSFFYMGDRWGHERTGVSTNFNNNAWFPLSFNGSGVPTILGQSTWTIDPATGVINGAPPQTITVNAAKDAMVKFAAPTTNFGTQNQLQVSAQTNFQKQAYLQFNITTIPAGATVTNVTLEVVSQTTVSGTINAKAVSNTTWTESGTGGITWNTKPAMGVTLGTGDSSHSAGTASTWTVTSHVTGNGNFTIGLDSTISGDTNFHSREATNSADRPRLKITYNP